MNQIYENVSKAIERSCGIDPSEISMSSFLFNDLNIDSIDLADILFELETEYNIELSVNDFKHFVARKLGEETPFEINGVITPAGQKMLFEVMPELPEELRGTRITINQVVSHFTVGTLCRLVEMKLAPV
jgi:acyl carrier protein